MAFTAESDFLREPPKVQETWLECFFASHVPTQLREYSDSSLGTCIQHSPCVPSWYTLSWGKCPWRIPMVAAATRRMNTDQEDKDTEETSVFL